MTADIEQLRADFLRDGCLILRNFMSEEELEEIETHLQSVLSEIDYSREEHREKQLGGILKNMNKVDPWFAQQLIDGKQAKLISAILEDDLETGTAAFFERIPGQQAGVNPHYDAVGHGRMGATIWIALDKADCDNGCLFYARGSHLQVFEQGLNLEGFDRNTKGAMPVELERGDASIHSSRTVHWSEGNHSERDRRAVTYFYWAANSKPNPKIVAAHKKGWMKRKMSKQAAEKAVH